MVFILINVETVSLCIIFMDFLGGYVFQDFYLFIYYYYYNFFYEYKDQTNTIL